MCPGSLAIFLGGFFLTDLLSCLLDLARSWAYVIICFPSLLQSFDFKVFVYANVAICDLNFQKRFCFYAIFFFFSTGV
jgi:hypothetical protein